MVMMGDLPVTRRQRRRQRQVLVDMATRLSRQQIIANDSSFHWLTYGTLISA